LINAVKSHLAATGKFRPEIAGRIDKVCVFKPGQGGHVLLLTVGRNLRRKTDPLFFVHQIAVALAAGLFFPVIPEKILGFGNLWNLAGHSVILGVAFLMTLNLDRSGFWKAFAFTLGIVIHFLLDADSGRAPFQVYPQEGILFWMYANAAVGLYFAASAFCEVRRHTFR
jgi:hypothetical protein